jgi:hypothetical protein
MPSLELRTAKQTRKKQSNGCVLLIEAAAGDAARISDELGSAMNGRFRMERVTNSPAGSRGLRSGGVAAVLPIAMGLRRSTSFFKPRVPILILSGADAEETARKAARCGPKTTSKARVTG